MTLHEGAARLMCHERTIMLIGEDGLPEEDYGVENGLVQPLSSGFIILAATPVGYVDVQLRVTDQRPAPQTQDYEDVCEVSAVWPTGQVNLQTFADMNAALNDCSAGLRGDVRVRVSVRGRDTFADELETQEQYLVEMWPELASPALNLAQQDEYGRNYRESLAM